MTPHRSDDWARRIPVQPSDPRPIWSQIEEGVRRLLASGALSAGDAVPSVRDLATALRINPATVSKAYQRLVAAGFLEVRRGDGTYVPSTLPAVRKAEQSRLLRQAALSFASSSITHGADLGTARAALEEAWNELTPGEGGKN